MLTVTHAVLVCRTTGPSVPSRPCWCAPATTCPARAPATAWHATSAGSSTPRPSRCAFGACWNGFKQMWYADTVPIYHGQGQLHTRTPRLPPCYASVVQEEPSGAGGIALPPFSPGNCADESCSVGWPDLGKVRSRVSFEGLACRECGACTLHGTFCADTSHLCCTWHAGG